MNASTLTRPYRQALGGVRATGRWMAVASLVALAIAPVTAAASSRLVVLDPALLSLSSVAEIEAAAAGKKLNHGQPEWVCMAATGLPKPGAVFDGKLVVAGDDCLKPRVRTTPGHVYAATRLTLVKGACDKPQLDVPALELSIEEVRRETALVQGLRELFKAVAAASDPSSAFKAAAADQSPWVWCSEEKTHVQQRRRSTITFSAKLADAKPEDKAATVAFITGPDEHWFLSGDAVVRGANEVKWDSATRTLVAQDKPNQLYLGLNYMVGDLYSPANGRSLDRVVFKLLVQPTRRPFDNVGLGIGYRLADASFTKLLGAEKTEDHSGAVIFVGRFWTRKDQVDAAGAVTRGSFDKSWRLGVSYSLGSLLKWLE